MDVEAEAEGIFASISGGGGGGAGAGAMGASGMRAGAATGPARKVAAPMRLLLLFCLSRSLFLRCRSRALRRLSAALLGSRVVMGCLWPSFKLAGSVSVERERVISRV